MQKLNFNWLKVESALGYTSIVVLFVAALIFAFTQISDLDIWLHLKSGECILQNKAIFQYDPFSFTLNHKPWIDHSWLFQVVIYGVKNLFGFNGLLALQSLVALFILIFFTRSVSRRREDLCLISLFGLALLLVLKERFTLRPDIFSILFLSYYLFVLMRKRRTKLLYSLIPAQILWVNFHGYSFLGIFLLAVFFIDDIFSKRINSTEKLSDAELKRFRFVLAGFLVACFINPYSYKIVAYPFSIIFNSLRGENGIFLNKIQELQHHIRLSNLLDFRNQLVFKLIFVSSFFSFLLNLKNFKIRNFLLWLVFAVLSLSAIRHVIYFALIGSLFAVYNFQEWFLTLGDRYSRNSKLISLAKCIICVVLVMIMFSKLHGFISEKYYSFEQGKFKNLFGGIYSSMYPKRGVDFVLDNNLPQRMFNDFNSGAYLIGRTYPRRKVFIDGRTEVYGSDFLRDYEKLMDSDVKIIDKIVNKYSLEGFFLSFTFSEASKGIFKSIYKDKRWKLIYFDEAAAIFLKDDLQNKTLIEKYPVNLNNWQVPSFNYNRYGSEKILPYPFMRRADLFNELGLSAIAIKEVTRAIEILPVYSKAYNLRAECYFNLGDFQKAKEDFRMAAILDPREADYRNNLGSVYLELGDLNLAVQEFNKALKLNKRLASARYNLALAYGKCKNNQLVLSNLKEAVKLKPKNFKYLEKIANTYYKNEDVANAIKYYKRALNVDPNNDQALVGYGVCLGLIGEHKKASEQFIQALRSNPRSINAYINLANFYVISGKYEQGIENFLKALAIRPKDKDIIHKIKMVKKCKAIKIISD